MVIAVILLPLAAVLIGSVQSEKALHADTRRVLPLEVTPDNFVVILTKGAAEGPHLRAGDLPAGQHQAVLPGLANSLIVASRYLV